MILPHDDQIVPTKAARECVASIYLQLAEATALHKPGFMQTVVSYAPLLDTEDVIGVMHSMNGFDALDIDPDEPMASVVLAKKFGDIEVHLKVSPDLVFPPAVLSSVLSGLYTHAYLTGTTGWPTAFDPADVSPVSTAIAHRVATLLTVIAEIEAGVTDTEEDCA